MSLENLKSKLHAIFENCDLKHEEIVKEENIQNQSEQEYKDPSGIVYKISFDGTNYLVKDQTGNLKDTFNVEQKDVDGALTKDIRNAIVNQLTPQQTTPITEPIKPEQPVVPSEPVEATV